MKKSDFVVVRINNNNCGYIVTERGGREVTASQAECVYAYCVSAYELKATIRHQNGDCEFWFN